MSTQFVMPALGESVEEGVITRWLKAVGDTVEADEPLLEVATDKVDTEIPAPCSGVIRELLAEENSTVAVGEPLAVIDSSDSTPTDTTPAAEPPPAESTPEPLAAEPEPEPSASESPAALQLSADIMPADRATIDELAVSAVAPAQAHTPAPTAQMTPATGKPEKMTRLRQTIAKRMVESLQVSAQLTTVVEADITALAHLRAQRKDEFRSRTNTKLSFLPFFAKAAVEALAAYPKLNASVSEDNTHVTHHQHRHLGIAVDSPKGLMVPVIRDASELSIEGLAKSIADLAERTRTGKIGPDELTGGTFTLTNTGSRGALFDTPIINQPQTGILGTGAVVDRVIPTPNGYGGHSLEVRSMVYLSITYDHRIVDGADAARFLGAIKNRLEKADFAADL
jgi:2-oxoglutarate dehydrogenase E2 component (dihydrolipoamide succinyltransferase)